MYDLEERTLKFSKEIITFLKSLSNTIINKRLVDQCIRSATSIGANYIEANDSLGKKDFIHKIKIARKEAKETIYWLKLIKENNNLNNNQTDTLIKESNELMKILSSIIIKSEKN